MSSSLTQLFLMIRESKMRTPSSSRIIEDVDLALRALEIFYLANWAAVEGLSDRNGYRKKVVGEKENCLLGRCTDQR